MNELTLIRKNGILYADSRDVAGMVDRQHNELLKSIRTYCDYLAEGNFALGDFFAEDTYIDSNNQPRPCYLLTRKGCDMVANKMTGQKGVLFTAVYVTRFEEMEKQLQNQFTPMIPQTYAEALRLAADQQETIENQEKLLIEQKPKVIFANSVETSKTSVLIGELAKIIKQNGVEIGRDRLFEWMRENGYLEKRGENKNLPTQRAMEMKLLEIKKLTVNNPDGSIRTTRTTKVTGKGQIYFVNIFLNKRREGVAQ